MADLRVPPQHHNLEIHEYSSGEFVILDQWNDSDCCRGLCETLECELSWAQTFPFQFCPI